MAKFNLNVFYPNLMFHMDTPGNQMVSLHQNCNKSWTKSVCKINLNRIGLRETLMTWNWYWMTPSINLLNRLSYHSLLTWPITQLAWQTKKSCRNSLIVPTYLHYTFYEPLYNFLRPKSILHIRSCTSKQTKKLCVYVCACLCVCVCVCQVFM